MATRMVMVGFRGEDLSPPLDDRDALDQVRKWLKDQADRAYWIRRRGDEGFGAVRSGPETFARVREVVPHLRTGDVLLVQNVASKRTMLLRVVEVGPHPVPTTGNDRVDLIFGAVLEEFDRRFEIVNMGALVNKPGLHGTGDAIDVGVRKPKTADDIHDAVTEIGEWVCRNTFDGAELPVNGAIYMTTFRKRLSPTGPMSGPLRYSGTPHVSHAHISDWPNALPGWV